MALVQLLDRWWWLIGPTLLLLIVGWIVVAVGLWLWQLAIRPAVTMLWRAFQAESVGGRPPLSVATVVSPRGFARFLYVPRNVYQVDNPWVARASLLRSVCGALLWLALAVNFNVAAVVQQLGAFTEQLYNAMALGAVVVMAAAVLVLVQVPAGDRRTVVRAFSRPLVTIAITATLVLILYLLEFIFLSTEATEQALRRQAEQGPWLSATRMIFGLWLVFFLLFTVYYNARHLFNAADAHPVLAPVGTAIVAWVLVAAGVLAATGTKAPLLASNYASPIPASVAIPLSVGGATLVTGLAAWEYWLLRKDSHNLLKGPWR